ncbi:hypothetical protein F5887DRAFT_899213, partial [Amanita rubescens]
ELGTSFVVLNVGELSRSILGSHFKHNNVEQENISRPSFRGCRSEQNTPRTKYVPDPSPFLAPSNHPHPPHKPRIPSIPPYCPSRTLAQPTGETCEKGVRCTCPPKGVRRKG